MQTAPTEARPYTPYDPTANKSKIAWLVVGAAAALGVIFWLSHRDTSKAPRELVQTGNLAASDAKVPALAELKPQAGAPAAATRVAPPAGPNVLGAALSAVGGPTMVPVAEVERQKTRAKRAESLAAAERRKAEALRRENDQMRQRLLAMAQAQQPPPPTQAEQILQSLAPALRNADER